MSSETSKVDIVQMSQHFLYLPLYYAKHHNFFGFIPKEYEINIRDSVGRTDESAFSMLMDTTSAECEFVDFAVCDPTTVFQKREKPAPAPVILAGLVTNAGFWAVDRQSHEIALLRDLGRFDEIISFDQGTTSYGIAARIFKDANKTAKITTVDPGQELVALAHSRKGVVALSPDVLAIHALLSRDPTFNIDLALGSTPEYSNVLVTALFTRLDVVRKHEALVLGLLRAVQRALLLIKFGSREVVKYVADRFNEDERLARLALEKARDSQVFPTSLEVSQAHWINAARAACDARTSSFDEVAYKEALAIYEVNIKPYNLAWKVGQELLSTLSEDSMGPGRLSISSVRGRWLALSELLLAVSLLVSSSRWKSSAPWNHVVFFALSMPLGLLPLLLFPGQSRPRLRAHWFLWSLAMIGTALWSSGVLNIEIGLGTLVTALVADVALLAV